MKYLKNYYYVLQPIGFLLTILLIRYLLGDRSALNTERIIICIVGGFIMGTLGNAWTIYQKKKVKQSHESE